MRLKKTETKRVNESADTIETIEELNSFLSDLIDHDVDVTSKDGAFGIHNPSFGYTSMTMKARNENGKWTIECLVPDIDAIDWSDYVDDAVNYIERWGDLDIPVIKKHGWDSSDETLILNGMSEVLTDYYLQHVGEDTETLRFFTLPIYKRELKDLITDEIQDMENNLEDFIFNEFFEEVKHRLEGGEEDTEESFRRTHRRIESRRMRKCRRDEDLNQNEKAWVDEILAVARDLRHTDNLIDSLIKKSNRGVEIDRDTLHDSSTIGAIIREAVAKYKKDYLEDDFDIISEITTVVRNAIKDKLTDYILEQVED